MATKKKPKTSDHQIEVTGNMSAHGSKFTVVVEDTKGETLTVMEVVTALAKVTTELVN